MKKKWSYDQARTPFQRLLEQPFEGVFEERRVKMAAIALKDTAELEERKQKMDRAVDKPLGHAHAAPDIPRRGTARQG